MSMVRDGHNSAELNENGAGHGTAWLVVLCMKYLRVLAWNSSRKKSVMSKIGRVNRPKKDAASDERNSAPKPYKVKSHRQKD